MKDLEKFVKLYTNMEEENNISKDTDFRLITESAKYPLGNIKDIFADKFNFAPVYQRNYTWNEFDQSQLIESFILNIPVPPIYLYEIDYDRYEILDGKQRITTLLRFYNNEFNLEGLSIKQELNGKSYNNFTEDEKKQLNRRYLNAIILAKESTESEEVELEYKRIIFERINKRGEKLNEQQLRNALYPGSGLDTIKKIANTEIFRREIESLTKKIKGDNLRDMKSEELALKTISLRYIEARKNTTDSEYLTETLRCINKFDSEMLEYIVVSVIQTFEFIEKNIGEKAFRSYNAGKYSSENNGYIYDPLVAYIMSCIDNNKLPMINRD